MSMLEMPGKEKSKREEGGWDGKRKEDESQFDTQK